MLAFSRFLGRMAVPGLVDGLIGRFAVLCGLGACESCPNTRVSPLGGLLPRPREGESSLVGKTLRFCRIPTDGGLLTIG